MSEEPKTEAGKPAAESPAAAPKIPSTPNMQFKNKYAIGDEVWVIFTNGPLLRVNQFPVKSLYCEVIGLDQPTVTYGFTIAGDGHGDGVNLTFVREDHCFFDREEAEKLACTFIADLEEEYEKNIQQEKAKYEQTILNLNEQKADINANNLRVPDRIVEAPPSTPEESVADKIAQEGMEATDEENEAKSTDPEPKADPATPEATPDKEQSNPESDAAEEAAPDNGQEKG